MQTGEVRALGVSRNKAGCLKLIADEVQAGHLNFSALASEIDERVIERLTSLKGIGTWTAEMFLMFALHRPDVFAVRDQGLRSAIKKAYAREEISEGEAFHIAELWRPYRSVASWYLWRSLD
jgi:DNA-3-methyladenine glycosylase II